MGLFNLRAVVAKTFLFTFRLLSGPGYGVSTKDKPSNTRLRATEAKSPRLISRSNSRRFDLRLVDVNDKHFRSNAELFTSIFLCGGAWDN